ncbi:MAG: hypothetical protein GVY16_05770 [Planctomycetes bacterium]|nr:flagellar basal body P-ring protein FlgI [Phycisphaerae bacterium]NBB95229.1 hypothetical protein [Planctomycetota bacterium]
MTLPRWTVFLCMALLVAAWMGGCDSDGEPLTFEDFTWGKDDEPEPAERVESIPELKGTIGEVCNIVSAGDTPIRAEGVVVGLYKTGSAEVPPGMQDSLVKYLKTQLGFGNPLQDMGDVSPMDVLASEDTAIVDVTAIIPPGAPKGTNVDVQVRALPRTQTTSLLGGFLLPRDLQWGRPDRRRRDLKPLARAEGSIFINPFIKGDATANAGRLREGVILNGGVTVRDMPVRLVLHQPDYHMADVIQKRINERFKGAGRNIATARTRHDVAVTIPPQWREDYGHFIQLIMHLPRSRGGQSVEAHAKRIAEIMQTPTANYDGLALVWEAIGRQVLPTIRDLYTSDIPAVRYYAARTGLRLGDTRVAGPIVMQIAAEAESTLQLDAIGELGRQPKLFRAAGLLERLLNDEQEITRIAAYEALAKRGDSTAVKRYNVGDEFFLDVVQTSGEYVIYATRTGEAKIVIFGRDMSLVRPVFFDSNDDEIRIYSKDPLSEQEREGYLSRVPHAERRDVWRRIQEAGERVKARRAGSPEDLLKQKHLLVPHDTYEAMYIQHVCLQRKLMDGEAYSEPFLLGFEVAPLIRTLAGPPRPNRETGKIDGVGLTYGQTVGVLSQLCEEGDIAAKFVLQAPPGLRRIYEQIPTSGRPE